MSKAADVASELQKKLGETVVTTGEYLVDVERIPTGVFPFDLSCGGGFPRGKVSIVYGPESSGKTNLFLLSIALEQKLNPHMENVFVDVENSFDPSWAKKMGVDVDKLLVLHPDHAEQAVDMVDAMLQAEDVSLIVVDSLAAMIPLNEQDSTAAKAQVGGASALIGKLIRKGVSQQSKEKRKGHYPTLLLVNQIRMKIGVMFGSPETMPGGNAIKFASGLTARIYGKNEMLESISKTMPVLKETQVVIQKWKVPIVAVNSKYKMCMIPHNGMVPGDVRDRGTVETYLRDMGQIVKQGAKWFFFGTEYKTLTAGLDALYADEEALTYAKQMIIDGMVSKIHGLPTEFDDVEEKNNKK